MNLVIYCYYLKNWLIYTSRTYIFTHLPLPSTRPSASLTVSR